jgi:adapter protein MecA 1/2
MKIEKINDRQIRCTLTREDLADRQLKLSELAYGSDKAKELFQDMMQLAAQDFGFEADNTPLVIEAVPISMDSLILIITKVDDPEELDTRFARFSPEDAASTSGGSLAEFKDKIEGADDILGLIRKISEAKKHAAQKAAAPGEKEKKVPVVDADPEGDAELRELTRFYQFRSLDDAIHAAGVLGSIYAGPNTLYKDPETNFYYLFLKKAESSAEDFNKICNVLSEYATAGKYTPGTDAFFAEHMEVIVADRALQDLQELN